ncbi:MAG: transposase, partial [Polyangiaceae bacterium]|nr:transposase [Polyangiaceae bacterium]
ALHYTHVNFCHIARNMRMTPAMAAGLTDHVWDLAELMDAALAATEAEKPEPKPLAIPKPEGPARELPGGRGFLRLVTEPTPALKRPPRMPDPPPVSPVVPAPEPAAEPSGQLDLFAWRPRPAESRQMDLFDNE